MTSKRVLITGAAGFIGFHLIASLRRRGDYVIGLDNFNDYYSPQLKQDRVRILTEQNIEIVNGDICDPILLERLITTNQITHIVHLAAQAGVRYSLVNPHAYITANLTGFLNILEACRHHPHIRLTYASSSSVYGTNSKIPFSIDDPTDHQASFYGVTKKSNELMAYTYHHLYRIPVTGLRFFTVYGPWGRPDMAYFSFTKAIDEGKPIDVYAYHKMRRDFTYIDDIINGTISALDLGADYELFNLGNHQSESLQTLIVTIEESLGKKAQLNHLPMQLGDVEVTYADISHSQAKLGFHPKTSLQIGIPRFIEWYKAHKRMKYED